MDQFTFMVESLLGNFDEGISNTSEEITNASLALIESTLLNGYTINEIQQYKTLMKKVTTKVA